MATQVIENEKPQEDQAPSSVQAGHDTHSDQEKNLNPSSLSNPNRDPGAVDTASNSTTLTIAPLVPEPETTITRFNSVTARDGRHLQGPPELPFNLRHHKRALFIFTFLCLAECCFVPIAFYYGFSQGTNVRSGMCTRDLRIPRTLRVELTQNQ